MSYTVEYSAPSRQDIENIALYIGGDSLEAALRTSTKIFQNLGDQLSIFPRSRPVYRGGLPEHLERYRGKIRQFVITKTIIAYYLLTEKRKEVIVVHVMRSHMPLEIDQ